MYGASREKLLEISAFVLNLCPISSVLRELIRKRSLQKGLEWIEKRPSKEAYKMEILAFIHN